MKKVIAIDGPSGAGKTTIAKLIANELGFNYLDTGALYRALALALVEKGVRPEDKDDVLKNSLVKIHISFINGRVYLNGRDVSEDIRTTEIDHYSSVFSTRNDIRNFLLNTQREMALTSDLVAEGRDTTTVVFPYAQKKIYLDASLEERAKRRYLQLREKGFNITIEESLRNIIERDKRDANRDIAPLRIAPDALVIDSSNLSIETVVKIIMKFVKTGS